MIEEVVPEPIQRGRRPNGSIKANILEHLVSSQPAFSEFSTDLEIKKGYQLHLVYFALG
jgi:hypothetical protein